MQNIKQLLFKQINALLDAKILEAEQAIASTKESRDDNTKSTAGDKHETARAMMQIELDNYQQQLSKQLLLKEELSKVNLEKNYSMVEFGSLVITSQGKYFISIGSGKIEVDGEIYYAISLASPLGKALHLKQKGNIVLFNSNSISIKDVL